MASGVGLYAMNLYFTAALMPTVVADRLGRPGTLYIPAQVAAALGVGLIALTLAQGWSLWLLVLGAMPKEPP